MPCPYEKKNVGWQRSGYMRCITEEGYGNFCRRKSNGEVHDCAVAVGTAER
jgi:hypothetical protein